MAALGPAGTVHLTLEDWATFAGPWLSDGRRIGLDLRRRMDSDGETLGRLRRFRGFSACR